MIVEFFGPPCAGKTTLARMLTARLDKSGYDADLWNSLRPTELIPLGKTGGLTRHLAPINRMRRFFAEAFKILSRPSKDSGEIAIASHLLRILPPRGVFTRVREAQYICRMARAWDVASRRHRITVFDQGFVQELCSLMLRSRSADEATLITALEIIPPAHLLVLVNASPALLEARSMERLSSLHVIERYFEGGANLDFIGATGQLHRLLLERGHVVLCASLVDHQSTERSLDQMEREVVRQYGRRQLRGAQHDEAK
ncbi:hypothetical protein [Mesorhizobium muleiense]|uniref:Thymidylate kinase n=1 Tax=Mesorhizobium muleiense TaxID=1004279 RepID=A0A1G8L4Q8_9HYPH|nr:hypothetical protein [Mesorhizobium muleiense]MCF6100414.1 hypothetical protein [Mesorhizobium muleiense]SDI50703.1 hypothetical protein SAMN05428953_102142 [Mesorhizobium muleiense]